MHDDSLQREAGDLRPDLLRVARRLGRSPQLAAIRAHIGRARHGLKAGVRLVGHLVDRLEGLGRTRERGWRVPFLAPRHARPLGQLRQGTCYLGAA